MSDITKSILLTCGVCCIYPIILSIIAVIVDRRIRTHGWRSLIARIGKQDES